MVGLTFDVPVWWLDFCVLDYSFVCEVPVYTRADVLQVRISNDDIGVRPALCEAYRCN